MTLWIVKCRQNVAIKILNTDHGNCLLQLIMGEGKTALIMPLISSARQLVVALL